MTEQQPKPRRRIMLRPYRNDALVDLLARADEYLKPFRLNLTDEKVAAMAELYKPYLPYRPPIIEEIARVRTEG